MHERSASLLALASCFDGAFSIDWLEELTGQRASQILTSLEEGVRRGHLTKKGPAVFCFSSSRIRGKWQGRLASDQRQRLHQRMAELLIRDLPDDEAKPPAVAHHLLHVPTDAKGCRWLLRAGRLHRRAYRYEKAIRCYRKVMEALASLQGEEVDWLYTEAALEYSKISTARHNTAKVLSLLGEASKRARRWNRNAELALLEMHLAKNEWLRSRYRVAMRHFQNGWTMAKRLDNPHLLRSATTFSTFFLFWQGRFREAVRVYERSVPEIEKFPNGSFPLFASETVGCCYAHIGQVTQGLGMVDAIRKESLKRGDRHLASLAEYTVGAILMEMHRLDEALPYLESATEESRRVHNDYGFLAGNLALAYIHYLKGDPEDATVYLRVYLRQSRKVNVDVRHYPYLMELCWAMEKGELLRMPELSLAREVHRAVREQNIFMKGVAYRYKAHLQRQMGETRRKILHSLRLSVRWLEESGHQAELVRSHLELARQYSLWGNQGKAREAIERAFRVQSPLNPALVPDDLRPLINDSNPRENLLEEILEVGRDLVTLRDPRELAQRILSAANGLTGAERGAIFLIEEGTDPSTLSLKASKNLTSEEIDQPEFGPSMKMIREVAASGAGRIVGAAETGEPGRTIRSRICVPMVLRDAVVGVLYHDNRLLSSLFEEMDLKILAYFAAIAAIAMDNARAYEEIRRLNRKLREEKRYYEEEHLHGLHFEDIIGDSPAILHILEQVRRVADTDANVLIHGETGVGKELVARAIHRQSPRRSRPFIRVHCSDLPDSLIPSELFGHEKGAFTGAASQRIGRFELADGGTIFLDEVGDLPLEVQIRLLRVLQTKEFERLGGTETIHSDFRLIAATNRDLGREVQANRFRADLFYRLNVFPIHVPPLRERMEDVPLLAHYFLKIHSAQLGKAFDAIPDGDMKKLMSYPWPGNVRELENVIERGIILSPETHFRVPDLGSGSPEPRIPEDAVTLRENERRHILWALERTNGKIHGPGGAAELLDIHPNTLLSRMKRLGVRRPLRSGRDDRDRARPGFSPAFGWVPQRQAALPRKAVRAGKDLNHDIS